MAFCGIRVPKETGRLISGLDVPGTKETPSEYHITLVCFDDNWAISEVTKALEATYDIVSKVKPFSVKANKVSHFPPRENHPTPIIAPIISSELHDLQEKLANNFEDNKIDFKKTFKEYKPHITLAYSDDGHDDFKIEPPIEFVVNEIVLWCGDSGDDRLFITFPLKGFERKKNAFLADQINLFEKLAKNTSGYLEMTQERRRTAR